MQRQMCCIPPTWSPPSAAAGGSHASDFQNAHLTNLKLQPRLKIGTPVSSVGCEGGRPPTGGDETWGLAPAGRRSQLLQRSLFRCLGCCVRAVIGQRDHGQGPEQPTPPSREPHQKPTAVMKAIFVGDASGSAPPGRRLRESSPWLGQRPCGRHER
jgi:hypothetical protein